MTDTRGVTSNEWYTDRAQGQSYTPEKSSGISIERAQNVLNTSSANYPQFVNSMARQYEVAPEVIERTYNLNPTTPQAAFSTAFNAVYQMGQQSTNKAALSKVPVLNMAQANIAYQMGADSVNNTQEVNSSEIRVRNGEERLGGQNTGGQVRAVAEDAGRNVTGAGGSGQGGYSTIQGKAGERVVYNGAEQKNAYYYAGEETEDMKKGRKLAESYGYKVAYFTGDNIRVQGGTVRGVVDTENKTVMVRADHPDLTPLQIMRHEMGHAAIARGDFTLAELRERLLKDFTDAEIDEMMAVYSNAYSGILSTDEAFEEICCDALGKINIFAGTKQNSASYVKAQRDIRKYAAEKNSSKGRAPPESGSTMYSREVNGKQIAWIEDNPLSLKDLTNYKKVAAYIANHIGEAYTILESGNKVYLGESLPGEYTQSKYTKDLLKNNQPILRAKKKVIGSFGEMIEIATNRRWEKTKHTANKDAKYGVYRYSTAFAFPVRQNGKTINVKSFDAELVILNSSDGKKYLYDIVNIKENTADETDLFKKDQRRQDAATRRGASENSIRSSEENVNEKFSREVKDAEEYFGTTYKIKEAGYICTDGKMLDFSGRHEGAPGGYRTVDHRDITDALGEDYGDGDYSGGMVKFMSEGNIRVSPEIGGINLSVAPNKSQRSTLDRYISSFRGEVVLDIDNTNGDTVASVEYPKYTHSSVVLKDIDDYFNKGKVPEPFTSGVKYSKEQAKYDYSKPFAEQIDDWVAGKIPKRDTLIVSGTPKVFADIGMPSLPVTINSSHVDYALNGTKDFDHELGKDLLKQLPEAIKKPVAIMTSKTKSSNSIVAMLEIRHNAKQVVVPVNITGFGYQNGIRIDSNAIASVYGKDYSIAKVLHDAIQEESNGQFRLYYLNEKKATALLQGAKVLMPKMPATRDGGFIHSLTETASPVKLKIKDVTESQQFKRWFAKSKVINSDGTPKIVYHQTENEFTVFETRREGAGTRDSGTPFGIFLKSSNKDIGLKGKRQMALYARIENPLRAKNRSEFLKAMQSMSDEYAEIINQHEALDREYKEKTQSAMREFKNYIIEWRADNPGADSHALYDDAKFNELFEAEDTLASEWTEKADKLSTKAKEALTKALESNGYDGVILERDDGSFGRSTDAYIALHPEQVKSATDNIGTFDNDNPDIRYSREPETLNELRRQNERKLAQATAEDAANENERGLIRDYQKQYSKVEGMREKLTAAQQTLTESEDSGADYDTTTKAKNRFTLLSKQYAREHRKLNGYGSTKALQNVLERVNTRTAKDAAHIDNRSFSSVGDRGIKPFQMEHPELHEYYKGMAQTVLDDIGTATMYRTKTAMSKPSLPMASSEHWAAAHLTTGFKLLRTLLTITAARITLWQSAWSCFWTTFSPTATRARAAMPNTSVRKRIYRAVIRRGKTTLRKTALLSRTA